MGYCMTQQEQSFFVAKEHHEAALEAIKANAKYLKCWIDTDRLLEAKTLEDALFIARWDANIDAEGNISDIWFHREKLGDEDALFQVIAPYVKEGSYIQMCGEDNSMWRWTFNGKECVEIQAHVSWESAEG